MRIKLFIPSHFKRINIQNIEISYESRGLPRIYFKCNKKYEELLANELVIFSDNRGRELFRSRRLYLHFRYYESDSREPKVKFEVRGIEVERFGLASKEYVTKILRRACNGIVIEPPPPLPFRKPRLSRYGIGVLRYFEKVIAFRYRPIMYRFLLKFRYIFKKIIGKFLTYSLESNAPT